MLSTQHPQYEEFLNLLDQVREEVDRLNGEIRDLKSENSRLRDQLKEIQEGQTDIFSAIAETDRMALRHQVLGLISKIDSHLEEQK